jgi:hypothetical protein
MHREVAMSRKWFMLPLTLLLGQAGSPYEAGQSRATLDDVRFMVGCWEGTFRDRSGRGTIEEHYTTPTQNVMLGTTRYIRDGHTVQFEFAIIRADSGGVRLTPYPNGRPSEHDFVLTRWAVDQAVFEAPEHDFPKRIIYRQDAEAGLRARIDGGASDRNGREWYLRRADCF